MRKSVNIDCNPVCSHLEISRIRSQEENKVLPRRLGGNWDIWDRDPYLEAYPTSISKDSCLSTSETTTRQTVAVKQQ